MTDLLVSVRNRVEARRAIRGGASIVDVKEPRQGSLGAASAQQWMEVVGTCPLEIPLSLALGELLDNSLSMRLADVPPVQFAKIGLAGCRRRDDWIPRWRWAIERLPTGTSPVAVTYVDAFRADAPDFDEILSQACQLGCCVMLWDTYDKSGGGLLEHLPVDKLSPQVAAAREHGMLIVVAGSLSINDLTALHVLAPDLVAVRGAVCAGSRTATVHEALVKKFAHQLHTLPSR